MWKTFIVVFLSVLVIDCGQDQGKSPQQVQIPPSPTGKPKLKEFMIFTYGVNLTENNAKAYVDADFNTVLGPVNKIELCRKYGLKLMVSHPGSNVAASLKGDKTVIGYEISDEPISLVQLHAAAESTKVYRKADPTHVTMNMLNQKGGNWLRLYVDLVDPDFISYSEYPWWYGGIHEWFTGEPSHFIKLEQYRDASMRANVPYIGNIEVNALRNIENKPPKERNLVPPPDNREKIRQSVYTSLAYGMKGIIWFTYYLLFDHETGEYNETGRQVAEINSDLKQIGPILFGLESIDVFHSVPAPKGSREATPDNWVQPLGKELVMGTFRDGKKNDYILVANKDIKEEQKVKLQFRLFLQEVSSVEMINKKTGEWKPLEIKIQEDERNHDYIYNPDNIPERIKNNITLSHKYLTSEYRTYSLSFFELYHTYRPPYQYIEFTLAKGDGELLRVKLVEGEDIPDPR